MKQLPNRSSIFKVKSLPSLPQSKLPQDQPLRPEEPNLVPVSRSISDQESRIKASVRVEHSKGGRQPIRRQTSQGSELSKSMAQLPIASPNNSPKPTPNGIHKTEEVDWLSSVDIILDAQTREPKPAEPKPAESASVQKKKPDRSLANQKKSSSLLKKIFF